MPAFSEVMSSSHTAPCYDRDCMELVHAYAYHTNPPRYYITMWHPGFNLPQNNASGFDSAAAARLASHGCNTQDGAMVGASVDGCRNPQCLVSGHCSPEHHEIPSLGQMVEQRIEEGAGVQRNVRRRSRLAANTATVS